MEPAALGRPVIVGSHYENFTDIVLTLAAARAVAVADATELRDRIGHLLAHPDEAEAMGERARAVCARNVGATGRALAALLPLIGPDA